MRRSPRDAFLQSCQSGILKPASAVPVPAIPTAAAVAAVIFANVRRVIVSLPMHPPFLWRACVARRLLLRFAASRPSRLPPL